MISNKKTISKPFTLKTCHLAHFSMPHSLCTPPSALRPPLHDLCHKQTYNNITKE